MSRDRTSLPDEFAPFQSAVVLRVYLNDTDDFKQPIESNSYGMVKIKTISSKSNSTISSREIFARPLLRGISDSITQDDLVIFTTVNDKHYYIGPLNTYNNPNFCAADFPIDSLISRGAGNKVVKDKSGYGIDYPFRQNTKIQKQKNTNLDFFPPQTYDVSKVSDLALEGRHGNSIRVGSRGIFPSVTIDNDSQGNSENISKGSTISMISNGSISQNFNINENQFRLSVDPIPTNENPLSQFPINKGNDDGEDSFNYRWGIESDDISDKTEFNQMIILSDRITFDARRSDFTVSSNNNINFGATNNFTLNNSGYSIINSNNIYLGEKARDKTEPIVLGDELRNILVRLLEILNSARANVQGVALPLVRGLDVKDTLNAVPADDIGVLLQELKDLDPQNGGGFFSRHHFIETNRSTNEG